MVRVATDSGLNVREDDAMPCFGIDGLYSGHEVNIGYRPYRTVAATAIRNARDPTAGAVVELVPGQGLGRQTVRNPDHLDLPPDRPAEPGEDGRPWIWVYARREGGSGWIPEADTEPWHSPPGRPCRGPAGLDFEPGAMPTKHGPHTSCGSRAVMPRRLRERTVRAVDVYLRYSPDGTAWEYLLQGDRVQVECHGPRAYAGVTVLQARNVAGGAAGWVAQEALA
jgi:hypothetical protein